MTTTLQAHEITPALVLSALQGRIGAVNGATAAQLVQQLHCQPGPASERRLRDCVVSLRLDGHPVCAIPGVGYFIAANDQELNDTCRFLLARAHTGLAQVGALKHKALPDLAGQFGIDFPTEDSPCN